MFIATIPNRNSPPTYLLRESYRQNGKVKNRTLANLSPLPYQQIQLIRRVLKGEELVPLDDAFRITRSLPHGHVQAVLDMIHRLKLPQLIASRPCRERDLIVALIVQRILHPCSKLAATRLWKKTTLAEELDGIYVIRTSESATALSTEDVVRSYKQLADVEQAFRSLKGLELLLRPIFHRLENRVKAHVFVCLLAYYVQWHLKRAWASLLFVDEHLAEHRAERDPVTPAEVAEEVKAKKASRQTEAGHELNSFDTLLAELATQCRNTCEFGVEESTVSYTKLTDSNPLQSEAFDLLEQFCRSTVDSY